MTEERKENVVGMSLGLLEDKRCSTGSRSSDDRLHSDLGRDDDDDRPGGRSCCRGWCSNGNLNPVTLPR